MNFQFFVFSIFSLLGTISLLRLLWWNVGTRSGENDRKKHHGYWYRTIFFYGCCFLVVGFDMFFSTYETQYQNGNFGGDYKNYIVFKFLYLFFLCYTPFCFFKSSLYKSKWIFLRKCLNHLQHKPSHLFLQIKNLLTKVTI